MTCAHGLPETAPCFFCRSRADLEKLKASGRRAWEANRRPRVASPERTTPVTKPQRAISPASHVRCEGVPGRECHKRPQEGSRWCFWHNPDRVAERAAMSRRSRSAMLREAIREARRREKAEPRLGSTQNPYQREARRLHEDGASPEWIAEWLGVSVEEVRNMLPAAGEAR